MRSFSHTDFGELDLSAVSVVLPARETAATIGPIVESLRGCGQVLVVDSASADGTAAVAAQAGAEVVQEAALMPEFGPVLGKGDAMWRSLVAVRNDVVVFVDADTTGFDRHYVTGLAGPLLTDQSIQFVKGAYVRPFVAGETVVEGGGGRVTELMARPLLRAFYPELAEFAQPLAGELAGRRDLFERITWSTGYAAEIAMLIDVWKDVGIDAMAQVDIGERRQPHQPLKTLSGMASTILAAVCSWLVVEGRMHPDAAPPIDFAVRPPMREARADAAAGRADAEHGG
jgi:glucosyl-3-phosphoglycerate synthase